MLIALAAAGTTAAQEVTMNVRQGPETVFDEPVEQIVPELEGARATDSNGRVGNEFVFWGYELADGRSAYLFACAIMEGVDCEARRQQICAGGQEIISIAETAGGVRQMRCSRLSVASIGERHPGCTDRTSDLALSVGLVHCM